MKGVQKRHVLRKTFFPECVGCLSIEGNGVTYLLISSLPAAQMAVLWAARRLSVHPIWLPRLRFRDRKAGTAGCCETGDVPSFQLLDLE